MAKKALPQNGAPLRLWAWVMAIAGLLLLLGSGIAYFINQAWAAPAQTSAGIGAMLLLNAALLRPDVVRGTLTRRQAKYASNAVIKSLAFIGILGLINFLAIEYEREYDLTEMGHFTLSPQTIQILHKLDRPVEVIGFFQSNDPRLDLARDYLERYGHYTNYLTYEFHDPQFEPILVQKYKPSNYGLVFVCDDKQYETSGVDEQMITTGLVRVASNEERKIYEEDLISIRSKQPTSRSLFLTSRQIGFTIFTTLIVIPAAVLAAGLGVWWKRR
ncbi:MAG: Gldg family protein [Anaerolineae bacterium]|nr:Gldg family protein [Anaerolineae bacterium]